MGAHDHRLGRRAQVEATIENLIAILDDLDGDADIEDEGNDEAYIDRPQHPDLQGYADLEDDANDSCDDEDIEQDVGEEREDHADDQEYDLGWTEEFNQANAHRHGSLLVRDGEEDTEPCS